MFHYKSVSLFLFYCKPEMQVQYSDAILFSMFYFRSFDTDSHTGNEAVVLSLKNPKNKTNQRCWLI